MADSSKRIRQTRSKKQNGHQSYIDKVKRKYGSMSSHVTKLMTGRDCFGQYLFQIGRREDAACFQCDDDEPDSAEHTVKYCMEC